MKDFKSDYEDLKGYGFTDREVGDYLNIPYYAISPLKSYFGITESPKIRKNKNGLTEAHFKKGLALGLSRRLINKRVRELGYTPDQACSFPKGSKGRKKDGELV